MKKIFSIFSTVIILASTLSFSGCAKGEDDPFLSFHSRDARITQKWILTSFEGTVVETTDTSSINTEYIFDGTDLYTTENLVTSSNAYEFTMEIRNNGEVFSEETQTEEQQTIVHSTKTSYWYWGNDDQNKTSVYLDLTGLFSGVDIYDIPRLAWNDMTLEVSYSDNYTLPNDAHSISKTFTMTFDVVIE